MKKLTTKSIEADVKANLRELCRNANAKCIHYPATQFTEPGMVDYLILTKHGTTIYVECKKPSGKLTKKQELFRDELKAHHAIYILYDGSNDEELINKLKE